MHELSLVMSIVDLAADHARQADATMIEEIELDIGELSSVEMNAFDFAWKQGIKNTLLQEAKLIIHQIPGKAYCLDCESAYRPKNLYDSCPDCGGSKIQITGGKEFRVKSLLVS